jgi:hypothetical protein
VWLWLIGRLKTKVLKEESLQYINNYLILAQSKAMNLAKRFTYTRVIWKVRQLGGENGQFWHNRASNTELGMKILQKEITGTQTSFSTNFGGTLSFILCFSFATYIFTTPTCTTTIVTLHPCA